jgi:hypothetical protein
MDLILDELQDLKFRMEVEKLVSDFKNIHKDIEIKGECNSYDESTHNILDFSKIDILEFNHKKKL